MVEVAHETVLIVEDEQDIANMIEYNLRREGYATRITATGEEALSSIASAAPDIALLDLMLPGVDGLEVCRQLKQDSRTRDIPIIMLTARSEDVDTITGLELGADDYVTKPFSPKVLTARIRTVIRRSRKTSSDSKGRRIKVHDIEIDVPRHEVKCGGEKMPLSATEFDILVFLSKNPGWVYSRSQIISGVKGDDYPVTERSVDVQILGLRKMLGERGALIETVRGIGYRMREERDG